MNKRLLLAEQILILLIISIILLCSWMPSPSLSEYLPFPIEIGRWIDHHDQMNSRTAIPFIPLGMILSWRFAISPLIKKIIVLSLIMLCIVSTAESGQLLLSERHFDIADILYGIAGGIIGILIQLICTTTYSKMTLLKSINHE